MSVFVVIFFLVYYLKENLNNFFKYNIILLNETEVISKISRICSEYLWHGM